MLRKHSQTGPIGSRPQLLASVAVLVLTLARPGITSAQDQPRVAQPTAQDVTSRVIARAQEALGRGDTAGASRVLSDWLKGHPNDVTARIALGAVYQSSGDLGRAETEFQSACREDPRSVDALVALASLRNRQGRPEEAEHLLARAVELQPSAPVVRLEWAGSLARLHRYPEAARALAGVPAPGPVRQHIAYERLKASIDLGRGDPKAAARDMELTLKLAPGDPNLQLATGIAESEAGAWQEAILHLQTAFRATRTPVAGLALLRAELGARADHRGTLNELRSLDLPTTERLDFRVRLAEILSRAGLHADAAQAFRRAIEVGPERPDLYFDLALAQFQAGQADAALQSAERSKSLGDTAALENLIGDIQEARGDSLDAAHRYQAAIALAPDQEQYRLALGVELLRHGTFEPALAVFEQAAGAFPNSSRLRVSLGLTQYFLERYPEAIKALLEAWQIDPGSELVLGYLGEIQLQQAVTPDPAAIGQICRYAANHSGTEALVYCGALRLRVEHDRGAVSPSAGIVEELQRAARLAPANPTARCALGQALEWTGQWREAERQTEQCLRLRPDSAEAHYRMANIARHLGETERAQQEIKLHDEAQRQLVETNALRDRTLQKFLYTMTGPSRGSPPSSPH